MHIGDTSKHPTPFPNDATDTNLATQDADSSVYVVVDAMECCDGVARHTASLPDMALEMPISYGAHML